MQNKGIRLIMIICLVLLSELCQKNRISFLYQRNSRIAGGSSLHINCTVWFASKKIKKTYELGTAQKRHFFLCFCLVLFHWKANSLILGDVCAVASPRDQRVLAQLAWKSCLMPSRKNGCIQCFHIHGNAPEFTQDSCYEIPVIWGNLWILPELSVSINW